MKKTFMVVVALVCATLIFSCGSKNANISEGDKTKLDTLSYALGANMGGGIKQQFTDIDLNLPVVSTAITEALTGKASQEHTASLEILREFFSQTLTERFQAHQELLKSDTTAKFSAFVDAAECDKISHAFGNDIGHNLIQSKLKIQYYWLLKGFNDGWEGKPELSREQIMAFLNHYFSVVLPAEAAERSAEWLAKKEKGTGVKKTESGLLYKVIKEGDMTKAAQSDEDVVKVHYVGRLQDGTVFDASRFEHRSKEQQEMIRMQQPNLFDENGKFIKDEPVEFPLNRVIAGWTEGMKLVGPGGKIMLYIPAELAYGKRGAGQIIGANEALEFEVELVEVTPAAKPEATEEKPAEEKPAEEEKPKAKVSRK